MSQGTDYYYKWISRGVMLNLVILFIEVGCYYILITVLHKIQPPFKKYGLVITVTSYGFVLDDLGILFVTLIYGLIHINVLFETPGFYITMKTTISLTLPDYCVNCISGTSKFKECQHLFEMSIQYSVLITCCRTLLEVLQKHR